MGYSEKHVQIDGVLESEGGNKWVIAGIAVRSQLQLRPISTANKPSKGSSRNEEEEEEEAEAEEHVSTTPKAAASRIPDKLSCPPAPRKRRAASRCNFSGVREFFNAPHDLETVFIRRPAW